MGSFGLGGVWRARRYVTVIIVGLLALAQIAGAASGVGAAESATAQTAVVHKEVKVGPTDVQKSVTLAVSLAPLINQQGMEDFVKALSDPKSSSYQKYLTPKEFTAKFFDPAGRTEVVNFLKSKNLTVKDSGVGSVINATGTVGQVQQAFSITLSDYQDTAGQTFFANDKTPALPTAVAPRITAVLGLSNAKIAHSHIAKPTQPTPHAVKAKTAVGCAPALNVISSFGGYAPNQFAQAFDFTTLYNAGFRGDGQTVAVFELSDWNSSDSDAYKACFPGTMTPVNRINVDGGTPIDPNGQDEVNLDVDVMLGMLPKLANLNVYVAPNTDQGVVDEYQKIATDNTASAVSTSWGICEFFAGPPSGPTSVVAAENLIFYQMATQGQQIFAASGDDGSEDCYRSGSSILNADDPASQPFMVGVGGTTVNIDGTSNAYVSETVWNHSGVGGGGGLSQNWTRPSWQTGPGTTNGFTNGQREVPDISAPADPNTGYIVYSGGSWTLIGGTSGAAPFTAAGFALMNQAFMARAGRHLSFASPTLYSLLTYVPNVLHDVTSGNNCAQLAPSTCVTAGTVYPATAGYDLATGVGTMKVGAIANYLVPPTTGIGIWRGGGFYLHNQVNGSNPTSVFGYGTATDVPLMCDWFGTGQRTPGVYRNGTWYISDSVSTPDVALTISFGGAAGDIPVCGDWTGQGKQTVGIYRGGAFYLSNSNTAPALNFVFIYGGAPGDIPVVGDWTGQGKQTVGIYRGGAFYLSNSNTSPAVNFAFGYGGAPGDIPVVGDWTNSGKETVGIYRGGGWYLSNSNTAPAVNIVFAYGGAPGDKPLVWK